MARTQVQIPEVFDWVNPDYAAEFRARAKRLQFLRANWTEVAPGLWAHYRANPWDFIDDWGITVDPRNLDVDLPAFIPFKLFPKQKEWAQWVIGQWKARKPGLTEKTRDMGMSWLSVALACTLCIFNKDMAIGFGSRKEEYVDKIGHPKSLFHKAREFMRYLPREFRAGWSDASSPHMRIGFPRSGSVITGEAGNNIGRGDRAAIYFVDESAFLMQPELVEASLSQTTRCRIDISSVNGMGNPFAQKRHGGKISVFTFHWRDDPRKDQAWYDYQCEILDPVTVAQEIDINYMASATGMIIPADWVQSSVGAFARMGLNVSGSRRGALDIADEGVDLNALCVTVGVQVQSVEAWSGKGSDIFATVAEAFMRCDNAGVDDLTYDADGLGAGARGDARVLNERRTSKIKVTPFRGSGGVFAPDKNIPTADTGGPRRDKLARTNDDYFANAKAQGWWELRVRFQRTHRALQSFLTAEDPTAWTSPFSPDDMIDLSAEMDKATLATITNELAQPTYSLNGAGKILVDKQPEVNGRPTKSPNYADSIMIRYAPRKGGFVFLA